ncbi:MAG: hypothetical protein IJ604_12525 [Prevotella sp.]|nr:hypothetical protein [Prevotella sp.]
MRKEKSTMEQKKLYSAPEIKVRSMHMEENLLTLSDEGVDLQGAGVDESDADNKGLEIW